MIIILDYNSKFVVIENLKILRSVVGQDLLEPGGHLNFRIPSPNTHSWVKIKKKTESLLIIFNVVA